MVRKHHAGRSQVEGGGCGWVECRTRESSTPGLWVPTARLGPRQALWDLKRTLVPTLPPHPRSEAAHQ